MFTRFNLNLFYVISYMTVIYFILFQLEESYLFYPCVDPPLTVRVAVHYAETFFKLDTHFHSLEFF